MEAEIIYRGMEMTGDRENVLLKLTNDSYARMAKSDGIVVVPQIEMDKSNNENVGFLNKMYKSFKWDVCFFNL